MKIEDCRLIEFPKISDTRGNLSFVEGAHHIPFDIKRIFYMYDIPRDSDRGGHAHQRLEQVIIPLVGGFKITLDDGHNKKEYHLNNPHIGLYVPTHIWNTLEDFAAGTVCLVLASDVYKESDYYRNYADFQQAIFKDHA